MHPNPALPAAGHTRTVAGELLAEIAWFEKRLHETGDTGDCAYDKALARSYEQAIRLRRERLTLLARERG
jgi:hypothetical protein